MKFELEKLLSPPFDDGELFKNLKLIKEEFLKTNNKKKVKKIAILGGSTTSHLKDLLNVFLLNNNIASDFYEGQFQLYYEEVVFDVGKLKDFNPDIIWIHTTWRNIKKFPDTKILDKVEAVIENKFNFYKSI